MIERELAHIRLLSVISQKGDYIQPDDMEFLEKKKQELEAIVLGIDEIMMRQIGIEADL